MKWYRNKEMMKEILKQNKNELEKYKHDKIVALLKDESNLIQDHLILLDENEKLKKAIEILKQYIQVAWLTDTLYSDKDRYGLEVYKDYENLAVILIPYKEYKILNEVLDYE